MDALPINFSLLRVQDMNGHAKNTDSDAFPRIEINAAMRDLSKIIWKEGGFRFTHTGTNLESFTYKYHCSQDLMHAKNQPCTTEVGRQRDGRRMARFSCKSKLNIRPCLQNRTVSLSIHHEWHRPYENILLSPVVQELIQSRVSTKTPSEIYREIQDIPEGRLVTRHQVYYIWQKANAEIWKRDPDPFISATMLLSEHNSYRDHHNVFTAGNVRALAFFAPQLIKKLAKSTNQLVMDATFGTNSGGLDLFAALAEFEGTGVPLGYCLVELLKPPQTSSEQTRPLRADSGAMTHIIQQFLEQLKSFGLNPRCFAIDKDAAEIAAVTMVWPGMVGEL